MKKAFGAVNRIPANLLRKPAARAFVLGCALAFMHCEDGKLAGSSVTTGNPTDIQVGFTGENGPVAFTGRIEIYGATQIPVPGFQPEPLVRMDVDGKREITLDAARFEAVADSLWPQGSLEGDSLARFNLIAIGSDAGAIVRELGFLVDRGRFHMQEGSWSPGKNGTARLGIGLSAFKAFQASLDPATLNRKKHHFLFLYGTGFYAEGDGGTFLFPTLPDGTHQPAFFSIPDEELQSTSPQDSVDVYSLNRPLSPDGPNPSIADSVRATIPIPETLK